MDGLGWYAGGGLGPEEVGDRSEEEGSGAVISSVGVVGEGERSEL